MTDSMTRAIDETNRRRKIQQAHNDQHNIVPQGIVKEVRDLTNRVRVAAESKSEYKTGGLGPLQKSEGDKLLNELEKQMKAAAQNWEFEKAALLRDQIIEIRQLINLQDGRPEWEKVREQEATDYVRELKQVKSEKAKTQSKT
jgi:excinuclease ABC subunit B